MRRFGWVAFALVFLMLAGATKALAEKRVALLIGNQSYAPEVGRLSNPGNDVALLEGVLKRLGFDVTTVRDAGLASLHQAVNAHVRRVRQSGPDTVGFFYYSGHGAADGATNYLIPVDAKTIDDDQLWDQSLRLTEITRKLKDEAGNATHFVVFDACRNTLKLRKTGTKAIVQSKGFVPVSQESGMLIAYATAEGALASDVGMGAGPYATVLADEVVKPGVEAVAMFRNVQRRVRTAIGQEPYLGFNALGDIYLAGQAPPAAAVADAAREWSQVDKASIAELETFVRRHAASPEADYARARIDALKQAAATGSPKPAPQPIVPSRPDAGSLGQPLACVNARDEDACERAGCTWFLRSCMTPENALAVKLAMEKAQPAATKCEGVEAQVGSDKRCLKPKDSFRDCQICPEMVVVPAGSFTMGSPANEPEREPAGWLKGSEDQLAVSIQKPLAVGRFTVTRGEFAAFVAATNRRTDGGCDWRSPGFMQSDRHPVVCVNWDDAKAYVTWLTSTTGRRYRLLSDAEREYVTRAGTASPFWWGETISTTQANYNGNGNYAGGNKGEFRNQTVAVDTFKPNPWGLYNVHGNAWEWTEDCWNLKNTGNPADGSPRLTGDCQLHVVRGGSFTEAPNCLRSAYRTGVISSLKGNMGSFRVARTLDP